MEQVIFAGEKDLLNATITEYSLLQGGATWSSLVSRRMQVVSTGGKIKNLRVKLDGSPGAGTGYDFTLMLNDNPTALTLEIADAATSGSNIVNEITVVAGDIVAIRCVPTGTPTARNATWASMFEGDNANESLILGAATLSLESTSIEYAPLMSWDSPGVGEISFRSVCPTAGVIKNLYIKLDASPGSGGDAYRFTVRLNGATVGESLIVAIVANDTTGNDLAHNLVVAAGDILTMMIEPLNSPSVEPRAGWGMTFVATIDGESIILAKGGGVSTSVTEYARLCYSSQSFEDAEIDFYQLGQTCTLKKLYMLLSVAPGSGKKYTFTVRIAGASSNIVAEVVDTATTGNSGALEDTVANDEYVNLMSVPDSTPTAAVAYWGLVSYIDPSPVIGIENKSANMGAKMMARGLI